MSRYNNNKRLEIITQLIERDGPICRGAGCHYMFKSIKEMDVDHIDGSEHHNCISNLQLLCSQCNVKKAVHQKMLTQMDSALDTKWLSASYYTVPPTRQAYVYVSAGTGGSIEASASIQEPAGDKDKDDGSGNGNGFETLHIVRGISECYKVQRKPTGNEVKDDPNLTPTMRKNKQCEKPFNTWLDAKLKEGEKFTIEEWCNGGANQFECSQESVWRYLKKRLDLPDCNPINGDLTLAPYLSKQVIVFRENRA